MKNMYACEKCGMVFDNWQDCQRCEEGHVSTMGTETWIEQNFKYAEGSAFPEAVILASKEYDWSADGTKEIYRYAKYKLVKEIKDGAHGSDYSDIEAARIAEEERAERQWAEYKARTERKEKEVEAV